MKKHILLLAAASPVIALARPAVAAEKIDVGLIPGAVDPSCRMMVQSGVEQA